MQLNQCIIIFATDVVLHLQSIIIGCFQDLSEVPLILRCLKLKLPSLSLSCDLQHPRILVILNLVEVDKLKNKFGARISLDNSI